MDATELALHRSNTKAFIDANPTVITLTPKSGRVRVPSGGWTDADGTPRDPQTFRVIELSSRNSPPEVRTQDGEMREVNFWLLGEHDCLMEIGDHWTNALGRTMTVEDIIRSNGYETRGIIVESGRG